MAEGRRRQGPPREGRRLPLRKSLLGRLLAVSALVAACSVAATAWLAVQTTSGAIKQEQGQNLTDDARIYHTLLGHAATRPQWDGVEKTVADLARQYGRRITLTTQRREPIADSATQKSPPALPAKASAVVDPLSADTALTPGAQQVEGDTDRIDPRAVGPFRLPSAERTQLRTSADRTVDCLRQYGLAADILDSPGGRPRIQVVGNDIDRIEGTRCSLDALDRPTATETKALTALNQLADACLKRQGKAGVRLSLDLSWTRYPAPDSSGEPRPIPAAPIVRGPAGSAEDRAVASCVGTARREQLGSYVSSPALLFIADPDGTTVPGFDLSPGNTARIAGVAALVLALTVGASVLAATRLVRPLHALTGAAQRMKDGETSAPVPVTADNEIGRLAAAFNDMSAHRARLEVQRRAMVSDVAHELRTPLSNIRGWLEAAQDGLADPDPAFVSSLLEEAVQLQHIIDDLQDLAEADAGALRLHLEAVRIDELLAQVAAAHQAGADTAGVTLKVSAADAPAAAVDLIADPVRLRQAVGNLVSNAVRHTPQGGTVTLRAYADGDLAVVEVADTGSGIPADDLPHVFDRFWRAEKSRSRRTGGSGLGLSIVRKLAETHGGSADAASTAGEGSVFALRIPAAGPEPGAAMNADTKPTAI
ncbi:sensor histidine kinase [Streptomyces sp. NPDC020681]|uniref:sensor histidine kinase n=1 Tax=Streptomyces sp. NPDC020681 TaxID=3365083 RepID=UPI0037A24253